LIPLHELEIILYADFPGMLRAGLKDRPPEGHNSFTRAIRAAWDAKDQPGFDANLEWESRYKEKKDKYKQLLVDKMAENQVQMVIKCKTCGEDSDKPPIFPCPTLHADQEAGDDDKPPIGPGVSLSLQPPIVPGRRDGYEDGDSGKTDLPKKVNVDGGDSVKLPIFACANLLADRKPGDEHNHSRRIRSSPGGCQCFGRSFVKRRFDGLSLLTLTHVLYTRMGRHKCNYFRHFWRSTRKRFGGKQFTSRTPKSGINAEESLMR
jgi:hypothetical protein